MKDNGAGFMNFLSKLVFLAIVFGLVVIFCVIGDLKPKVELESSETTTTQMKKVVTNREEEKQIEDRNLQIQEERSSNLDKMILRARISLIRDFGNGVYKFPFIGDEFDEVLAEFIGTHTNLEFVSGFGEVVLIKAAVDASRFGATKSYTVVFREKSKP